MNTASNVSRLDCSHNACGASRSWSRIAGAVLIALIGGFLCFSATMKLIRFSLVISHLAEIGFTADKVPLLGLIELPCAVLLLIPATRSIGLPLVAAYLGGAICAHFRVGDYAQCLPAAILLSLSWLGIALRHSGFVCSFAACRSGHCGSRSASNSSPATLPSLS